MLRKIVAGKYHLQEGQKLFLTPGRPFPLTSAAHTFFGLPPEEVAWVGFSKCMNARGQNGPSGLAPRVALKAFLCFVLSQENPSLYSSLTHPKMWSARLADQCPI